MGPSHAGLFCVDDAGDWWMTLMGISLAGRNKTVTEWAPLRIGCACEAEERAVRLNGGEAAHPPTRNARSAAMISGPTSSMSPSRRSRAGDWSPSCSAGWVVKKEESEDELLAADLERLLAPCEVEALAESQHEALDVRQQRRFQVALLRALGELHEIQNYWISHDALHRFRVVRLQSLLEVGDRRSLALMQACGDVSLIFLGVHDLLHVCA
jgi:hypothetical protein